MTISNILITVIIALVPGACGKNSDSDTIPPAESTRVYGVPRDGNVTLHWIDPDDKDFNKVLITYIPGGSNVIEVEKGLQTAIISGLSNGTEYEFTLKTVDASGNESAGVNSGPYIPVVIEIPAVYMTTDISPEGLIAIYDALGRKPAAGQKVAVKISTGEGNNSNHLRPGLIGDFVKLVNGDLVECNTAYVGNRLGTTLHYMIAAEHGYTEIATVVIMDENGSLDIPVKNGRHLNINRVGAHFTDYQFHIVLSHFKGHQIGGYGGALKNMSIGYASTEGKCLIHSAGKSSLMPWEGEQNAFLESMAESAKAIVDYAGNENFIYINVMNRLSVDCDCNANPAEPLMADVGILASLDPVALDKACLDIVYASPDGAALRARINRQNGTLTDTYAADIGLGSLEYTLVSID